MTAVPVSAARRDARAAGPSVSFRGGEDAEQVTDGADAHGEPRVGEVRAELAAGWAAMVAM
ncbi:hypothetical protein [Nocardia brasiliensis]|uniref:hypothetical protein n=1 Tax=Nocardia brasiliensis TaxID=37326 RepID=UPI0024559EA6|nr:hypothetical protein [Nocardia brasiliensis]